MRPLRATARQTDRQRPTGVFGGTFDPVHYGHLNLARQLLERHGLAQVIFVPAAMPPHKRAGAVASAAARLTMLERAIAGEPRFRISDYELRQGRVCYTSETAAYFSRQFGPRLVLIIGADSLRDLHRWHDAPRLVARFRFLVYPRPGYPIPSRALLTARFGAAAAARLLAGVVPGIELDVSSTAIRAGLRQGKSLARLVPGPVSDYIYDQRLYGAARGAPRTTQRQTGGYPPRNGIRRTATTVPCHLRKSPGQRRRRLRP